MEALRTEIAEEGLTDGPLEPFIAREVPVCHPDDLVDDVLTGLRGSSFEAVDDIAVCEGPQSARRLVGLVPLRTLVREASTTPVRSLMDADPPVIGGEVLPEHAAWKAVRHGETSVAVVDDDGRFRGLVTPAHLVEALLHAHDTDFARLGGYLATTESARSAIEEPVARRLWHRLPWLSLGLLGAAVSAWVVGLFEGPIAADVRLAFFIPGVVYLADAVGTQTEALLVRGFSVGAPLGRAVLLEARTGPVLGGLLAVVSLPAIWLAMGDAEVAIAVAVALFAACGVSTVVAAALPWSMTRSGVDPAFGSGPLATVVQDLLTLLIYFAVATAVMG
ncbi:magnesium transporter [Nocardioides sp. JQ2195]|uniref:magnesium transporter n=1 Tax=Nocardioides sp. JQ2195 TaxID=2592334 RepID=UPI00143EA022|nr:magnesium transporter [Nocardioides sp. JQ2195]QIX26726.1 magnesium transporter [Nocardioides sp. JQ2195]